MKRLSRAIGMATQLGLVMGLSVAGLTVLGLVGGRWVDRQLATSPVGTLLLLVAGAIAGQLSMYRMAKRSVGLVPKPPHKKLLGTRVLLESLAVGCIISAVSSSLATAGLWLGIRLRPGLTAGAVLGLIGLAAGVLATVRILGHDGRHSDGRGEDGCQNAADGSA